MSFLGDLVNTIGGDRAPAPPTKSIAKPIITGLPSSNTTKSLPSTPTGGPLPKPVYKGTAGSSGPLLGTSLKRKAEDDTSDRAVKALKSSSISISDLSGQKPSKLNGDTQRPSTGTSLSSNITSTQTASSANAPAKAPAKGSYAAMMAKAKEAQQVKVPSQVGMIKHQAVDKVKTSKLAERKKEEQTKGKNTTPIQQPSKPGQKPKPDPRRRSASPVKKSDLGPKPIKAPRPPLHGPATAPAPAYKGTMGQTPKKSRQEMERKKRSKYDEYLGTDEEEDDDDDGYGYGGGDDYYSDDDESDGADMEGGGIDALWEEERMAERAGRAEDAREAALEAKLKREKLERKQKLAALAAKKR